MRASTPAMVLAILMLCSPLAQAKKDGAHGNPHGFQQDEERPGKPDKKGRADRLQAEEPRAASISIGITLGGARSLVHEAGIPQGSFQPLPPGMRNRLAKGKPLPPGIAKKQVPPAMLARLPVHAEHEWLVIGVDLVLVNIRTKIPVDILPGVF
ncbi:anti-virulence regulator CigR family protein [Uliginosibacterium sp. 31-16]|uniref:anti-virulence regulator CigR family protein n=1 Tax=Uliginosibacterium sp. 31-16 TaxID=3068315 RepID=UPI00273EEECE|nr:anti-virulence regulator CigR family protein [Uliginosibacterium sp. 31-16]MDP5239894.1 anti-virulence regulator CigR family protein [Uliginosibacterium sp. 31-16]